MSRLAKIAPAHWLRTYGSTDSFGNRLAAQNPSVTAGFKCAPEISPTVYIIARTIKPKVKAIPGCVTAPPLTWFMTIAPVPANTRKNVPSASAKYFLYSAFIRFASQPAHRACHLRRPGRRGKFHPGLCGTHSFSPHRNPPHVPDLRTANDGDSPGLEKPDTPGPLCHRP